MMMLGFNYTLPYGWTTMRDNRLEEIFGDELEALKHTVECEEASAPCCGVRDASIHLPLTGLR